MTEPVLAVTLTRGDRFRLPDGDPDGGHTWQVRSHGEVFGSVPLAGEAICFVVAWVDPDTGRAHGSRSLIVRADQLVTPVDYDPRMADSHDAHALPHPAPGVGMVPRPADRESYTAEGNAQTTAQLAGVSLLRTINDAIDEAEREKKHLDSLGVILLGPAPKIGQSRTADIAGVRGFVVEGESQRGDGQQAVGFSVRDTYRLRDALLSSRYLAGQ